MSSEKCRCDPPLSQAGRRDSHQSHVRIKHGTPTGEQSQLGTSTCWAVSRLRRLLEKGPFLRLASEKALRQESKEPEKGQEAARSLELSDSTQGF